MELEDQNIGAPPEVGHYRDRAAAERFARAYDAAFAVLPPGHARDITSGFGRTRIYQFADGTGTPLVLLPGWGASTPMWAPHLDDLLAFDRPLLAIDPIGQAGGSRQTSRLRTTDEQVGWFDELLAELCPSGAHVIGASAGGSLALHTAVGSPHHFRSLTVLDPPSVFAPLSATFMALGIGSATPVLPMPVRRRLLDAIAGTGRSNPDDPITQLSTSAARDFRARLPPPSRLGEHKLRALEVPVLALIGGASRVHAPARAADRARVLPRGRVEVWNGAGHVLNATDPGRFISTVRYHIFCNA